MRNSWNEFYNLPSPNGPSNTKCTFVSTSDYFHISVKLFVSLLGSITTRKINFCTSAVIKFLTISEYSAEGHGVIVYAMHNRAE